MIRTQKGFTLVELLVAATIVGILAVFATVQYRNTAAETRWQQAKSKLGMLANAVQRAQLDYPNVQFSNAVLTDQIAGVTCSYPTEAMTPGWLISCNYLENQNWSGAYFSYFVCKDASESTRSCPQKTDNYWALACVVVKNEGNNNRAPVPSKYYGYRYCVGYDSNGQLVGQEITNNAASNS